MGGCSSTETEQKKDLLDLETHKKKTFTFYNDFDTAPGRTVIYLNEKFNKDILLKNISFNATSYNFKLKKIKIFINGYLIWNFEKTFLNNVVYGNTDKDRYFLFPSAVILRNSLLEKNSVKIVLENEGIYIFGFLMFDDNIKPFQYSSVRGNKSESYKIESYNIKRTISIKTDDLIKKPFYIGRRAVLYLDHRNVRGKNLESIPNFTLNYGISGKKYFYENGKKYLYSKKIRFSAVNKAKPHEKDKDISFFNLYNLEDSNEIDNINYNRKIMIDEPYDKRIRNLNITIIYETKLIYKENKAIPDQRLLYQIIDY
jgi:hypothetical protein